MSNSEIHHRLSALVNDAETNARVPFSNRPDAAVLLLSNGFWIPGVRLETASFSLVIPALQNAVTTAFALRRTDIVGAALSVEPTASDLAYLRGTRILTGDAEVLAGDQVFVVAADPLALPVPGLRFEPEVQKPFTSPADGIEAARSAATAAFTPESNFPVGCVLVTADGHHVPGVNVEHSDWRTILCAERNALGTAISYGYGEPTDLYLTCLNDPKGTPCGACRQLLLELAPAAKLWMDRADEDPQMATPDSLLPNGFSGSRITPLP